MTGNWFADWLADERLFAAPAVGSIAFPNMLEGGWEYLRSELECLLVEVWPPGECLAGFPKAPPPYVAFRSPVPGLDMTQLLHLARYLMKRDNRVYGEVLRESLSWNWTAEQAEAEWALYLLGAEQ